MYQTNKSTKLQVSLSHASHNAQFVQQLRSDEVLRFCMDNLPSNEAEVWFLRAVENNSPRRDVLTKQGHEDIARAILVMCDRDDGTRTVAPSVLNKITNPLLGDLQTRAAILGGMIGTRLERICKVNSLLTKLRPSSDPAMRETKVHRPVGISPVYCTNDVCQIYDPLNDDDDS